VTSAYMLCFMAGGALGSVTSGLVYSHAGWRGVCALGAGYGLLLLLGALRDHAWPVAAGDAPAPGGGGLATRPLGG
jgi:hypothetical protein